MVFLRNVNESLNTECLNLNMQSDTMILALVLKNTNSEPYILILYQKYIQL